MLFCNKLLNVLFCTRFTWLKRHTVCKTLAVCIGNTSLFQRPAEIFSDREQPRKNFSRAAIPGCRITAPDFLLQKNTLLFQKWQTGSRHWAERDTSSPDCPMPEGNPFHYFLHGRRGSGPCGPDWAPPCFSSDTGRPPLQSWDAAFSSAPRSGHVPVSGGTLPCVSGPFSFFLPFQNAAEPGADSKASRFSRTSVPGLSCRIPRAPSPPSSAWRCPAAFLPCCSAM